MEDKKILNEYKRVQRSSWKNMPLTDKSKKLIEAAKTAHQEKAIKGKVAPLFYKTGKKDSNGRDLRRISPQHLGKN